MNKMTMMGVWLIALFSTGCNQDLVEYNSNDLKISIEKGEEWLHKFPLFLGINKKNPPQIAIWTEDMKGHYLSTVYVTHKIATQSWLGSPSVHPSQNIISQWLIVQTPLTVTDSLRTLTGFSFHPFGTYMLCI